MSRSGPSISTQSAPCASEQGKGHGERRSDHASDHELEPEVPGLTGGDQRFGQPPGLIELDVDGIVTDAIASSEPRACTDLSAQTGDLPRDAATAVLDRPAEAARSARRLPKPARCDQRLQIFRPPGLVGVDDEPGLRRRVAHGREPFRVSMPPARA